MTNPLPLLPNRPLTQADRAIMHGIELRLRPVFAGWEASVLHAESGDELSHTPVQDTTLAALLLADALWHQELSNRKQESREERMENVQSVENKSGMPRAWGAL